MMQLVFLAAAEQLKNTVVHNSGDSHRFGSLVWAENPSETPASHSAKTNGLLDLDIPDMVEVHVRPGESVRHRSMVRGAHRILEQLNGIDLAHGLKGGQTLVNSMTKSGQTSFIQSRDTFHDRRKTRYLNQRGGLAEVREYRVRTGDTVWNVPRTMAIFRWLVRVTPRHRPQSGAHRRLYLYHHGR